MSSAKINKQREEKFDAEEPMYALSLDFVEPFFL